MKQLDKPPLLNDYVHNVCAQVRAIEMHRDIRDEISCHVEELADELMTESPDMDREDAIRAAVKMMGDPVEVGTRLDRVHRPKTDWGLVVLLAAVLGIALLVMYSADQSLRVRSSVYPFHLFEKKAIYFGIGLLFLFGLRLFDYRKLLRYSNVVYGCMLALMLLSLLIGIEVNGANRYLRVSSFVIDVMSLSPFVLIVALCGILTRRNLNGDWRKQWAVYVLPPLPLYTLVPDLLLMLLYGLTAFILFALVHKSWSFRICIPLLHLGAMLLLIMNKTYLHDRLSAYLDPYSDPQGAGYMIVQSLKVIREAGWLGHGIGSFNITLPNIYSDMAFAYIIFALGWLGGIVVAWVVAMFLLRIANSAKIVSEPFGKMILHGLGTLIGLKFLWSIAMTLGWLPMVSVQLPFIGFGGLSTIVDMAVVGGMMSVYRRKDMNRKLSRKESIV